MYGFEDNKKMRLQTQLLFLLTVTVLVNTQGCHYSCANCTTADYYTCSRCNQNRGNNDLPIYGMCYCSDNTDEDIHGNCQSSGSFNYMSKTLIIVFIALALTFSLFAIFAKGMKYFLYKTIEDVQELSLIVFINLYFPQQFDIFLTYLYRFNISSYTFQNIAMGSLFTVMPDSSVASTNDVNIYGKYRLLRKTANFFSNQFTWMIVFFSILAFAILVRFLRNCLKKRREFQIIRTQVTTIPDKSMANANEPQPDTISMSIHSIPELTEIKRVQKDKDKITIYWAVNKLYNMLWFNLLIVFFYFSLIEININIFTQIANLTFSSNFATVGAFFSALFLAVQITALVILFLKAKEEMIKPEWMRDYSYTPTIYLIRTNYKTITKYFWFISCFKKILLAMMVTTLYDNPLAAIIAVSSVHALYICLAIYCQPFERKYIRLHFYLTEAMKMFMFLSLVTFTTKYAQKVQLINLTVIFYSLLAFIFGLHLFFLLLSLCIEKTVYHRFLQRKFCPQQHQQLRHTRIGYRSEERVYIYVKE